MRTNERGRKIDQTTNTQTNNCSFIRADILIKKHSRRGLGVDEGVRLLVDAQESLLPVSAHAHLASALLLDPALDVHGLLLLRRRRSSRRSGSRGLAAEAEEGRAAALALCLCERE